MRGPEFKPQYHKKKKSTQDSKHEKKLCMRFYLPVALMNLKSRIHELKNIVFP
jgi:hypothetical protein